MDDLLGDYLKMHKAAFSDERDELADAGLYRFRKGAELHATSPEVVRRLHAFVKAPTAKQYSIFEELAETQGTIFLRDLLETTPEMAIPLDEVEPVEAIVKRFSTQAMSSTHCDASALSFCRWRMKVASSAFTCGSRVGPPRSTTNCR